MDMHFQRCHDPLFFIFKFKNNCKIFYAKFKFCIERDSNSINIYCGSIRIYIGCKKIYTQDIRNRTALSLFFYNNANTEV